MMAKLRPASPVFLSELRQKCVAVTGSEANRVAAANVAKRISSGEHFPTRQEIRGRAKLRLAAQ